MEYAHVDIPMFVHRINQKLLVDSFKCSRYNTPVKPSSIRVIAVCLFRSNDHILVQAGFDSVRQQYFYRPLGGEVHPGETAKEALIREIHEELNQVISDLRLLGVLESLFVLEGVASHEIVFVYDAKFTDYTIYEQSCLSGREDDGEVFEAAWRSLDSFDNHHRLVPESLTSLL